MGTKRSEAERGLEMKTVTQIKANVDNLQFGYWDLETQEFIPIDGMSAAEMQAAAEKLECSELLLDALVMFAASISEMLKSDLVDIWKKVS